MGKKSKLRQPEPRARNKKKQKQKVRRETRKKKQKQTKGIKLAAQLKPGHEPVDLPYASLPCADRLGWLCGGRGCRPQAAVVTCALLASELLCESRAAEWLLPEVTPWWQRLWMHCPVSCGRCFDQTASMEAADDVLLPLDDDTGIGCTSSASDAVVLPLYHMFTLNRDGVLETTDGLRHGHNAMVVLDAGGPAGSASWGMLWVQTKCHVDSFAQVHAMGQQEAPMEGNYRLLPRSRQPVWHPLALIRGGRVKLQLGGCRSLLRVYKGAGTPYNAPECSGARLAAHETRPAPIMAEVFYPLPRMLPHMSRLARREGRERRDSLTVPFAHGSSLLGIPSYLARYTVGEARWLLYEFMRAAHPIGPLVTGTGLGCVLARCHAQTTQCMRSPACRAHTTSVEGGGEFLHRGVNALVRSPWYTPWVNTSRRDWAGGAGSGVGGGWYFPLQRCYAMRCSGMALDELPYRVVYRRALTDEQMSNVLMLAAGMHPRYTRRRGFGAAYAGDGSGSQVTVLNGTIPKGHTVTFLHTRFESELPQARR